MKISLTSGRPLSVHNYNPERTRRSQHQIETLACQSTNATSQIELNGLYSIIKLHYPRYAIKLTNNCCNMDTLHEFIGNLLRDIKCDHNKQLEQVSGRLKNSDIELRVIKDINNSLQVKLKTVQHQFQQLQSKLKIKQADIYNQNQQIFIIKERIQGLEKQLVLKNIQVAQNYEKWQDFKQKLQFEIQNYKMSNESLSRQNKKLRLRLSKMEEELDDLQHQVERVQKANAKAKVHVKYLEPFSEETRHNGRSRSSSLMDNSKGSSIGQQTERAYIPKDLLAEVEELKQNQSDLLDRLAQRDRLIQSLQISINNSRVDELSGR